MKTLPSVATRLSLLGLVAVLLVVVARLVTAAGGAAIGDVSIWLPVTRAWAGSLAVSLGAALLAAPLALSLALLLVHQRDGRWVPALRSLVRGLHEVPAVVHGLAGWVLFRQLLGFGGSMWTVILTLMLVSLPTIASMAEWSLRKTSSPERRNAALALGATGFQATLRLELRAARGHLVWVLVRGWARAFGATVPLLLVGPASGGPGRDWLLPILTVEQLSRGQVGPAALSALVLTLTVALGFLVPSWAQGHAMWGRP